MQTKMSRHNPTDPAVEPNRVSCGRTGVFVFGAAPPEDGDTDEGDVVSIFAAARRARYALPLAPRPDALGDGAVMGIEDGVARAEAGPE
jgi:hypothetical protein